MPKRYETTAYRYPSEKVILGGTLILAFGLIVVTSSVTFCMSAVFVLVVFGVTYMGVRNHHQSLVQTAFMVTPQSVPELNALVEICGRRLGVKNTEVFVTRSDEMNAYTFGIDDPKAIVLHMPLLKVMDRGELMFIIGHEMGHVKLGHTWINSIVGGIAGLPSTYTGFTVLQLIMRSWNRACEYSADRAGMLACGDPNKAISALIRIVAGPDQQDQAALAHVFRQIDAEDDVFDGKLAEVLATHPLPINRIDEIEKFAKSKAYRDMMQGMDQNAKTH